MKSRKKANVTKLTVPIDNNTDKLLYGIAKDRGESKTALAARLLSQGARRYKPEPGEGEAAA